MEVSCTLYGKRDADGWSPPGSPTTTCRTCTSAHRPACCCWRSSASLSRCCGGSSATRTSKCYRVPGSADTHPIGVSLLSLGAPASASWGFPPVRCTARQPPARVPFHLGLAESPYPDRNLDKGSVHPSPRGHAGPEPLFVTHVLACGPGQHLMPGCHLSPTPMVIGSSTFSCSEFPQGYYAYTSPSRPRPGAMAPRTACLSPPGSWLSRTPAGTVRALLAPVLLGVLTDMLGEGMGQPSSHSDLPCPCCPHMSYGFCPSRWAARPWPWAGPTPEPHSCVFWES